VDRGRGFRGHGLARPTGTAGEEVVEDEHRGVRGEDGVVGVLVSGWFNGETSMQ